MRRLRWNLGTGIAIFGIAATITLLNAVKPLHMDDSVYYSYATHLAAQPDDPYGGDINLFWMPPKRGMQVLVPVFLPYWWSLAHQIHGDNTFLCKLWLLPFSLMLVAGTWGLARRFAPKLEPDISLLVAFSPAVLPGMNFMLDIPELGFAVFSIYLFILSCESGSTRLAVLAGAVAGLAINTKWTGIVVPGVLGLYAVTHQRWRLGVVAGVVACSLFAGWEAHIWLRYGTSHFVWHAARKVTRLLDQANTAKALVAILGGTCPVILLLGLHGLRRRRLGPIAATVMVLALVGLPFGLPSQSVFLTFGVLLIINLTTVATVLLTRRPSSPRRWRGDANSLFLVLWLMLEIVGVFVLSPYSAVRRVVGIVVVATLLTGRLASLTGRTQLGRSCTRWVVAAGVALGLFYFLIDLHEARVDKNAAETVARDALALVGPGETVWYAGRWGFRHYAARAGLKHIATGRTELKRGDLLVVHDNRMTSEQRVFLDPSQIEEVLTFKFDEHCRLPYRTVPSYYAGKNPLERLVGPRLVVHIFRVINPFIPLGLLPREFAPKGKPVGALREIDAIKAGVWPR